MRDRSGATSRVRHQGHFMEVARSRALYQPVITSKLMRFTSISRETWKQQYGTCENWQSSASLTTMDAHILAAAKFTALNHNGRDKAVKMPDFGAKTCINGQLHPSVSL